MSNTSRLGLYLPVATDNADVKVVLKSQLQAIDDSFDATICTSTTRPITNLYDGRLIYETDTGNLMYRDTGINDWVIYSNGRNPLGRIGYITTSAASGSITGVGEIGPYLSVTFNARANREYAVHFSGTLDHVSGHNTGAKWIVLRSSLTSSVATTDNQIGKMIADVADNSTSFSIRQMASAVYFPNVNSITTVGVFLQSGGGTNPIIFNSVSMQMFAVEDIGYRAA